MSSLRNVVQGWIRMPRFRLSLRARVVVLVLVAVAPALLVIARLARDTRDTAIAEARHDALALAHTISAQQDDVIVAARQLLTIVMQLPAVRDADSATCSATLADILAHTSGYTNFWVDAPDGTVLCASTKVPPGFSDAGQPWLAQTVRANAFTVSTYQTGRLSGRPLVIMAMPVRDADGAVTRVVATALDLTWLNATLALPNLARNTDVIIVDRTNVVLGAWPQGSLAVGQPLFSGALADALRRGGDGAVEALDARGEKRLYGYTAFGAGTGNMIAVGVPLADVLAEADQPLTRDLLALSGVILLALGAAWFGGELFVLRPIRHLLSVTRQLQEGNLAARTGYRGPGEFQRLGEAFDAMADALQQRDAELRQLALRDALTGLPNRLCFQDRLEQELRAARRGRTFGALLVIDLDGFKVINDTYGHAAGDAVLRELARRMSGTVRAVDTVARYGGDEFVALLPHVDENGARTVVRKLREAVTRAIPLAEGEVVLDVSIGLACYPRDGLDAQVLFHQADQDMYASKRDHKIAPLAEETLA